jgi:hypothetical protein
MYHPMGIRTSAWLLVPLMIAGTTWALNSAAYLRRFVNVDPPFERDIRVNYLSRLCGSFQSLGGRSAAPSTPITMLGYVFINFRAKGSFCLRDTLKERISPYQISYL